MTIMIDSRQKPKPHNKAIEDYILEHGFRTEHCKCLVGDYTIPNRGNVAVDTKQDLEELYTNYTHEHKRFQEECIRAQRCGIQLVVLIADTDNVGNKGIENWQNPRQKIYESHLRKAMRENKKLPRPPVPSSSFAKGLETMTLRYGTQFELCPPGKMGKRIIEILSSVD